MARPSSSLAKSASGSGLSGGWNSWQTRSSPALVTAASFNLRDFSLSRKRVPDPVDPGALSKVSPFDKIDLVGGNGKWRKNKAKEDFERRRLEEEELQRQARLREMELERRRAERRDMRRKAKEEEERKRREEEERQLQERREREKLREEQQERERVHRMELMAERQRRMPKTCSVCSGSGSCQACGGKGFLFSTFLVSAVDTDSLQEYGRAAQGCPSCGGCKQGIRGALVKGAGKCSECFGHGKIWPDVDEASPKVLSPKARMMQAWSVSSLT